MAVVFAASARAQSVSEISAQSDEVIKLSPFEVSAESDVGYLATNTLAGTRFNTALKDTPASLSIFTPEFMEDIAVTSVLEAYEYGLNTATDTTDMTGNPDQENDIVLKVRGIRNASLGRNYFAWANNSDSYNTERLTFSRGPNSVIFGIGGAGGIINTDTKRAFFGRSHEAKFRVGSWEDYRVTLDLNEKLTDKIAVRANLVWQDKEGWRDYEFQKRKGAALAATWRPFPKTQIRIDSEKMNLDQNKAITWTLYDGITSWIDAGRPLAQPFNDKNVPRTEDAKTGARSNSNNYFITNTGQLLHLNGSRVGELVDDNLPNLAQGRRVLSDFSLIPRTAWVAGPSNASYSDFEAAGIFVEQQVAKDLFVEAAANVQHRESKWARTLGWNDFNLWVDASAVLPDGTPNPFAGEYFVTSAQTRDQRSNHWNTDYRVTASYQFDLGKWFGKHQIAGLVSRREDENYTKESTMMNVGNPAKPDKLIQNDNAIIYRTYVSFTGPNPLNLPDHVGNPFTTQVDVDGVKSGLVPSTARNDLTRIDSAFFVAHSSWWKGRLVTTLGLRRDVQDIWGSTHILSPNQVVLGATRDATPVSSSGNTETWGAVFHVTDWLALAYNKSNNFTPQQGAIWDKDSQQQNNQIGNLSGEGEDVGVRLSLLDGRLNATLAYYETNAINAQKIVKFRTAQSAIKIFDALGVPYLNSGSNWGQDTADVVSQGTELELTANPTKNWRLHLNAQRSTSAESNIFPYQNKWFIDNAALIDANRNVPLLNPSGGRKTVGDEADSVRAFVDDQMVLAEQAGVNHIRWAVNMFTRYSFTAGPLKNWYAGAGVNWRGPQAVGLDADNIVVWGGDYYIVNANLGYSRKMFGLEKPVRFQLNVNNLLDNDDLLPTVSDGVETYRWRFIPPRSVTFTTTVKF